MEKLEFKNEIAQKIARNSKFSRFILLCAKMFGSALEPSFIAATICVRGFILPGFTFPEKLRLILHFPTDDIEFNLFLLRLHFKKSHSWFSNFAKTWKINLKAFNEAISAASELAETFNDSAISWKLLFNRMESLDHLTLFKPYNTRTRFLAIGAVFADMFSTKNISIYTRLHPNSLSPLVFYNSYSSDFFTVSGKSILYYIPESVNSDYFTYAWTYEMDESTKPHDDLPIVVKSMALFMVKVPAYLRERFLYSNLIYDTSNFTIGSYIGEKLEETKVLLGNDPDEGWTHFTKYNRNTARISLFYVSEYASAIKKLFKSEIDSLFNQAMKSESIMIPIPSKNIILVAGPGFDIVRLISSIQFPTDKDNYFRPYLKKPVWEEGSAEEGDSNKTKITDHCPLCLCPPGPNDRYIRNKLCGHLTCCDCFVRLIKNRPNYKTLVKCQTDSCDTIFPLEDFYNGIFGAFTSEGADLHNRETFLLVQAQIEQFLASIFQGLLSYYLNFNKLGYRECKDPKCGKIFRVKLVDKQEGECDAYDNDGIDDNYSNYGANNNSDDSKSNDDDDEDNLLWLRSSPIPIPISQPSPEIQGRSNSPVDFQRPVFCFGCKTDRCPDCGHLAHPTRSCFTDYLNRVSDDLRGWLKDDSKKRRFCPAPNCFVPIEKRDGCNHVKCEHCQTEFCWVCDDYRARTSQQIYAHLHAVHGGSGGELPIELQYELGLII